MKERNWQEVLDFWFDPDNIGKHFDSDPDFDNEIRDKFLQVWEDAGQGLLVHWRSHIKGRLAEIIVLDQFSRNMWRGDARSYSQDKMALALAQEVVNHPDYDHLNSDEKRFILLPFMHSESLELHDWADQHYQALGDENLIFFEKLHVDVLKEFGRYPYRNEDLGRESSPAELKALEENKDGFYANKSKD